MPQTEGDVLTGRRRKGEPRRYFGLAILVEDVYRELVPVTQLILLSDM